MSHYFAFVALVAVLVLIPGPAVILVMRKAVTAGYPGALRVAAGVLAADLVWAAAAAAGVSAVIVAASRAHARVRWHPGRLRGRSGRRAATAMMLAEP
jgi:threonine/homoserine/homoserine lactone efflux protein